MKCRGLGKFRSLATEYHSTRQAAVGWHHYTDAWASALVGSGRILWILTFEVMAHVLWYALTSPLHFPLFLSFALR